MYMHNDSAILLRVVHMAVFGWHLKLYIVLLLFHCFKQVYIHSLASTLLLLLTACKSFLSCGSCGSQLRCFFSLRRSNKVIHTQLRCKPAQVSRPVLESCIPEKSGVSHSSQGKIELGYIWSYQTVIMFNIPKIIYIHLRTFMWYGSDTLVTDQYSLSWKYTISTLLSCVGAISYPLVW